MRFCSDKHQFYCTTCKSVSKENAADVEESNEQLSCSFCAFTTKRRYNLTRHLERKHQNPVENITVVEITNQPVQEQSKVVMNMLRLSWGKLSTIRNLSLLKLKLGLSLTIKMLILLK